MNSNQIATGIIKAAVILYIAYHGIIFAAPFLGSILIYSLSYAQHNPKQTEAIIIDVAPLFPLAGGILIFTNKEITNRSGKIINNTKCLLVAFGSILPWLFMLFLEAIVTTSKPIELKEIFFLAAFPTLSFIFLFFGLRSNKKRAESNTI